MGGGGRSALNQFPLIQQEALVYSLMERHTYFITVCVIASLKGHYSCIEVYTATVNRVEVTVKFWRRHSNSEF